MSRRIGQYELNINVAASLVASEKKGGCWMNSEPNCYATVIYLMLQYPCQ